MLSARPSTLPASRARRPLDAHRSPDLRRLRAIALLATGTLVLLVLSPRTGGAQISALARKAAAKAAKQAAGMGGVGSDAPTFDEHLLELTDARVQAVIAGVQAAQGTTAPDGTTRAQLVARAGADNERRNALLETRDNDLRRFDDDTRRVAMCTESVLDSLTRAHNESMARKAQALATSADPMASRLMQEVMQATMEAQRLAAAGDTAGAMAVQRALMRKQGIDPARDSTVATARCGKAPAKAPWHRQADSLLTSANAALRMAQDIDQRSASTGAKVAGMTTQQFALARERVHAFASSNGNPPPAWRFSPGERTVLLAHLSRLKAITS